MVKQRTGASINARNGVRIRPILLSKDNSLREGVFGLAVLGQNTRSKFVELVDELENGILGDAWVVGAELLKSKETGVWLAEDGMAVSGDDTLGLEQRPQVVDNLLVRGIGANLLDHAENEREHLLVGETVERSCQTSESSRVREEGV